MVNMRQAVTLSVAAVLAVVVLAVAVCCGSPAGGGAITMPTYLHSEGDSAVSLGLAPLSLKAVSVALVCRPAKVRVTRFSLSETVSLHMSSVWVSV